jgi:hypothetical protein
MDQPRSLAARCLSAASAAFLAGCTPGTETAATPPGGDKTAQTRALETGAALLQTQAPLRPMDVYLVGFHAAKDDPTMQMEAHHYCAQVNQDFMQCTLFDGNTTGANLIGIEFIISETVFEGLPEGEKQYWHPHNYEILSGTLAAPGIPAAAERELFRGKMNSYGKTWHVWNAAPHGRQGDALPLGAPVLEWSFNRDGEALPGLVEDRDRRLAIDTAEKRRNRAELASLARPQAGVDVLKDRFGRPTTGIPGVVDKGAAAAPAR